MPNTDFEQAQLSADLRFLIEEGLEGKTLSKGVFQKLLEIQTQLRQEQSDLALRYKRGELSDATYIEDLKHALRIADKRGEDLLGYDVYHRIFGEPDTIDDLIDPDEFIQKSRLA